MENKEFLKKIAAEKFSNTEKSVALIWFVELNAGTHLSILDICREFENAGYGSQNATILRRYLEKDKRLVKKDKSFILREKYRAEIDRLFTPYLKTKPIQSSDSVLSPCLFLNSKGYVKKVVSQLNASYDYSLFDCCAVMCRRLLETLIIEIYESNGRATEIKDKNGNFYMFADLLGYLNNDQQINISRNTKKALTDFKKLGDLSAHNRKFNATIKDIDDIKMGLRVASEELLNSI